MKDLGHGVTAYSRTGRRIGPHTEALLREGVDRAHTWLPDASQDVGVARGALVHPGPIGNPLIAAQVDGVRRAARLAFNVPDDDEHAMRQVVHAADGVLQSINHAFGAGYEIVDIGTGMRVDNFVTGATTAGYVTPNLFGGGHGRVHVNYGLLRELLDRDVEVCHDVAAWTLIHESSHKHAHTRDICYAERPGYQHVGWQQTVQNADSYSMFVYLLAKPDKMDRVGWPWSPILW